MAVRGAREPETTTATPIHASRTLPDAAAVRSKEVHDARASPRPALRSERAPLPPADAPLATTYAELSERAAAGDAEAAARLFRDASRCLQAPERTRRMKHAADRAMREDTSHFDAARLREQERALAQIQSELADVRRVTAACAGVSDGQLQLAPIALQAALLGDLAASECYVSGHIVLGRGLVDHPERLAEYKANALAIAQSALQRGDWNMVAILQQAYSGFFPFGPLHALTGESVRDDYRLLRLRRLGADAGWAADIDRELAIRAQRLTAKEVADADAWARQMYADHFAATSSSPEDGINTCYPQ